MPPPKEYPGGFALLKVYEGGYMVNFYKSSSDLARQWSQVSGGGYLGLYPAYALGTLADRNHVVDRDFSALAPRYGTGRGGGSGRGRCGPTRRPANW